MSDLIHQKVQLAYSPETLPAVILERFEPGWTAIQACRAVGFIDDDAEGKYFVLYEDGPGPRSGILVDPKDVVADSTGGGEGGEPPLDETDLLEEIDYDRDRVGVVAPHVTKVFLRDRKTPVLVVGEFNTVQSLLEPKQPHPLQEEEQTFGGNPAEVQQWPVFQRVERGNICSVNEIAIRPAEVQTVESERA